MHFKGIVNITCVKLKQSFFFARVGDFPFASCVVVVYSISVYITYNTPCCRVLNDLIVILTSREQVFALTLFSVAWGFIVTHTCLQWGMNPSNWHQNSMQCSWKAIHSEMLSFVD